MISRLLRLNLLVLCFSCLVCLMPMHAAHAQMSLGGGGGGAGSGSDPADDDAKAAAAANAPPPALPGAESNDPAAPSGHASMDMNPTAALFDAINRGDLTAAKEALTRGADLAGTNVLGEKPIESAIDLNRNDITFLLLSMRNNEEQPGRVQVATDTAGADKPGHLAIHGRSSSRPVEQASYADSHAAQDGGAAKPEVGFLGFDGS